ncbi:branched-chain amino acid transport system carrier protein [Staphylococcus aureus]|uniref:Branched-chain amino acid transport system carrier protein n=1 Tax=Staphylococcus aureus TaxID=1280 RepID=A0A380EDH6_STAAU|nr:branched-chain amino acid transport system carrier protein [Staphylococcus aureus]
MIAALVDGLKASPEFISSTSFSQTLINFSQKYLPLSDIGMGWVVSQFDWFHYRLHYL